MYPYVTTESRNATRIPVRGHARRPARALGRGLARGPDAARRRPAWLRHIRDVFTANRDELEAIADPVRRRDRLCELNVVAQVANVCHTTIVQDAWRRGQPLTVHGWIYALADGLLRDLGLVVESAAQIPPAYRMA